MSDSYSAIQTLQTQIRMTNSALAAQAAAVPAPASGVVNYLSAFVPVANGSSTVAWTTVTGVIPAGASEVIIQGYCENFSSNVSHVHVWIRQSAADSRLFELFNTVGGATGATGSGNVQMRFPVNTDGSFQWSSDSGGAMGYSFSVIGYVK